MFKPDRTQKIILYFLLILALLLLSGFNKQSPNQQSPDTTIFKFPLGLIDGHNYAPRINYDNSILIENTDFDAQNPDLKGQSICFAAERNQLHHGGEDLYRTDNQSTAQSAVTAIADGIVIEYNPVFDYPGKAIVIEHNLSPSGDNKIYSIYMHLENVQVHQDQEVHRGDTLGYVLYRGYDPDYGNYPEFHAQHYNSDDSHLHFEIRYFPDAVVAYNTYNGGQYANCANPNNGLNDKAGRGYTPPEIHAYDFPAPGAGYTDPTDFINSHSGPAATVTPIAPVPEEVKNAEMDELFTFIGDKKTKST